MEIELQGFKFKVKGDRPEVSQQMAVQIAQAAAAFIEPAMRAAAHPDQVPAPALPAREVLMTQTPPPPAAATKRRGGGRPRGGSTNSASAGEALRWTHDPAKWGTPGKDWNVSKKSPWLLLVAETEVSKPSLSSADIAKTFNAMFPEAGEISVSHINRDLKKLKAKALVTKDLEDRWQLAPAGKTAAAQYVQESITAAAAN